MGVAGGITHGRGGETLTRLAAEMRQTVAQGAQVSGQGPLELAVADLVDAVVQIRRGELRAQHAGGQQGRQSAAETVRQMVNLAQLATNRVVAAADHVEGHSEAGDPYGSMRTVTRDRRGRQPRESLIIDAFGAWSPSMATEAAL